MAIGHQFPHFHQFGQRPAFPHHVIAIDRFNRVEHAGFKNEKAAVDPIDSGGGLFLKSFDQTIFAH